MLGFPVSPSADRGASKSASYVLIVMPCCFVVFFSLLLGLTGLRSPSFIYEQKMRLFGLRNPRSFAAEARATFGLRFVGRSLTGIIWLSSLSLRESHRD